LNINNFGAYIRNLFENWQNNKLNKSFLTT
jgi:hypothetical protein